MQNAPIAGNAIAIQVSVNATRRSVELLATPVSDVFHTPTVAISYTIYFSVRSDLSYIGSR